MTWGKYAFTLAEVLITLGIIGVVAAMTIPNLMAAHKAQRLRAQFLKSYSTVQQVFKQMEADDVSLDPAAYEGRSFYLTFMTYLKGAMNCQALRGRKVKSCYDDVSGYSYKAYDGKNNITNHILDDGQILLQDGTLLLFENSGSNINGKKVFVSIDLNNWSGPPNRAGFDLFTFEFLDGELRVMGDRGTTYPAELYCAPNGTRAYNGMGCAYKAKNATEYFKHLVKYIK